MSLGFGQNLLSSESYFVIVKNYIALIIIIFVMGKIPGTVEYE